MLYYFGKTITDLYNFVYSLVEPVMNLENSLLFV